MIVFDNNLILSKNEILHSYARERTRQAAGKPEKKGGEPGGTKAESAGEPAFFVKDCRWENTDGVTAPALHAGSLEQA